MRTRPLLFVALVCLGGLAHATGAHAPLRNQIDALLADPAIPAGLREVARAKAQAKALVAEADDASASKQDDAAAIATVLLEAALEWAQLSKELIELRGLQTEAEEAETRQMKLEAQLKREKAHLEETEARRGRALAALKKLGDSAELSAPAAPSAPAGGSQ